jgi:hypothetical protein
MVSLSNMDLYPGPGEERLSTMVRDNYEFHFPDIAIVL